MIASLALSVTVLASRPAPAPPDSLAFGRFGTVALYGDRAHPAQVVLFISGDGGWNLGVVQMARHLASLGALVVGIDIRRYLHALRADSTACAYPAAEFEGLSQYVQQRLALPRYVTPMVVGYSSGATLAYVLLAEAPVGTFRGAISLGFCPELPLPHTLCPGDGLLQTLLGGKPGLRFIPSPQLSAPWIALHGTLDQVCQSDSTAAFVRRIDGAEFVSLPGVGHGFGVASHWMPQFDAAFRKLAALESAPPIRDPAVADLPLVAVPARSAGTGNPRRLVAVMLSGDGGWAGLDRTVADDLADAGVPVLGFNSLQYFWRARTPDELAADLTRAATHALAMTGMDRVMFIGYSFGADVLPFALNRLPTALRERVGAVALIGVSGKAAFEFHVGGWFGKTPATALPTEPEIAVLGSHLPASARLVCLEGEAEPESACPSSASAGFQRVLLPGGHHLGGDYKRLAAILLTAVE